MPLVGFTTTAALACACGCSVFDVGGLDLPQEQDHGGRVFLEYLERRPDAELCRQFQSLRKSQLGQANQHAVVNVGFSYNFNRDWGVMVRIPTLNRTLTTDTGAYDGM